jgi:hypothetical protein
VLSGRGLCDGLITRPEGSYRLWCVVVCEWGGHGPLGAAAPETNIKYDLKHLNCALYEDVRDEKPVQNSWPLKMEPIGCPETSAYNNQTPGNYPKEYIHRRYLLTYLLSP